jgi:hypothetical protein
MIIWGQLMKEVQRSLKQIISLIFHNRGCNLAMTTDVVIAFFMQHVVGNFNYRLNHAATKVADYIKRLH